MIIQRPAEFGQIRAGLPRGTRVGVTSGCFDLLHYMHLVYLERCRRKCDFLLVGVDSDDLVRANKGPLRPNIPEMHRVAMVAALSCVDGAFVMGSLKDLAAAVRGIDASYVFKNAPEIYGRRTFTFGAALSVVPDIKAPGSTSEIIEGIVASGLVTKRKSAR